MQKSTMESASWQRPLYGFEISQNQAGIPLKSGVLGRPGGGYFVHIGVGSDVVCSTAMGNPEPRRVEWTTAIPRFFYVLARNYLAVIKIPIWMR